MTREEHMHMAMIHFAAAQGQVIEARNTTAQNCAWGVHEENPRHVHNWNPSSYEFRIQKKEARRGR